MGDFRAYPPALVLAAALGASGLAGCGQQPCDGGDLEPEGPVTRLDVSLDTCNHRPVARARVGAASEAKKRSPIELDGTRSADVDGATLDFTWRLVEPGPGVQLMNASAPTATFIAQEVGGYLVELVVSDGDLDSEPVRLIVNVRNNPPVADAGEDAPVAVGAVAALDGTGSTDADGDELSYTWFFETRPPGSAALLDDPTAARPNFTVDAEGLYVIALQVFDGDDTSAPDRVRIGGGVTGGPPTADAGPDDMGILGKTYQFDGSGSSDPDGDALFYQWRWVEIPDGSRAPPLTTTSTSQPIFLPDLEGDYIAELVVDDGFYFSDPDTVRITVVPGTGAPGDLCEIAGCQSGSACFDGICVGIGRLRFSLSWTAYTDFDLHVLTPERKEIYFADPMIGGGELDVDDCVGSVCLSAVHVENVVFKQDPPSGRYQVWVVNYNGDLPGDFRIEVQGAAQAEFLGSLPAVTGQSSMRYEVRVP